MGWKCPDCGHVYAPSVQTCWHCPKVFATASTNDAVSGSNDPALTAGGAE